MRNYREAIVDIAGKAGEYSERALRHLEMYKQSPFETAREDAGKAYRNVIDNHMKRFACMMAFSGFTMPLKSWLETSGKSINGFIYDTSPEIVQHAFTSLYTSMPEILQHYINFDTSGEEMSDLTSIAARAISMSTGYLFADAVIPARNYALIKLDLRKAGKLREAGKIGFDFTCAATIGSVWEYIKYAGAQLATKSLDVANRTNAAAAVALPTAALHTIRGWFLDVAEDLVGYKESERTPSWLANKSDVFKKNIFYVATAAALLGTAAVYYFNNAPFTSKDIPSFEQNQIPQKNLESKVRFDTIDFEFGSNLEN